MSRARRLVAAVCWLAGYPCETVSKSTVRTLGLLYDVSRNSHKERPPLTTSVSDPFRDAGHGRAVTSPEGVCSDKHAGSEHVGPEGELHDK